MRVDISRVTHVVTGPFQPTNEVILVLKFAIAVPSVRPVKRDLHCAGRAGDGVRPIAVVAVEALAGRTVVRLVVERLVGSDGLLVQDGRASRVVAHYEDDVVLVTVRPRELHEKHAAGPSRRHG